jgi:hypothetical protein
MSTTARIGRLAAVSPKRKARIAGFFYLLCAITGAFAEMYVRGNLIVAGDAAATAANILAHEQMFRLGLAADIIAGTCYIVVTILLYELLKPVNPTLSLLAAAFSLVGCAVGALSGILHLAPLVMLGGEPYLGAFSTAQLKAASLALLTLHAQGNLIGLVFFGIYCFLIGFLILRSRFLPRIVGALMALAGLCYLVNSFAHFISPAFASHLSPWIILPCGIGELALTFWLLVMGVNEDRWIAQT